MIKYPPKGSLLTLNEFKKLYLQIHDGAQIIQETVNKQKEYASILTIDQDYWESNFVCVHIFQSPHGKPMGIKDTMFYVKTPEEGIINTSQFLK